MRTLRSLLFIVVLASTGLGAGQRAAAPQAPTSRSTQLAPDRLTRLDTLLQQYVDENRIAGAVALVLRDGKPVYERAVGWSDKESGRRMTPDTIFRIASQSKALTSVAALSLMEEGKLALSNPVSEFIPAYAKTTVLEQNEIVPAKRPVTVRDLLTHTSGVSYGTDASVAFQYAAKGLGPAAGYGWYTADKNEPICDTMERLASLPFVSQPGAAWVYGYNTDILGCVVERAAGMPLDRVIQERIAGPLGLKDTHFYLPAGQEARLASVYGSGDDDRIVRSPEGAKGQGHYVTGPRKSFSGGAGLLSTAHDYATFLEMIRNGGALNGVRVLSPRTVALMTTNQVGTLHSADGLGFGLGFETTDRYGASGLSSVGSFSWGGAYGTQYRVDPEEGLTIVLMIQLIPNHTDIAQRFSAVLYQAIVPRG
jgi:CubicO group peptidase (beta-lactamase class C family)